LQHRILNECSRGSPCFVAMIYAEAAQRLESKADNNFCADERGKSRLRSL
jgi:hypothetical protein